MVDPLAKSQVPVVGAGDVQRVRVRKPLGVTVRRRDYYQYHLAFRYYRTTYCDVFPGEAFGGVSAGPS